MDLLGQVLENASIELDSIEILGVSVRARAQRPHEVLPGRPGAVAFVLMDQKIELGLHRNEVQP